VALSDLPDHVGDFDPARPIICVCRSGARSARAATFLLEQGLPASNLEGGMMAWDAAGAPMVADAGEPVVA